MTYFNGINYSPYNYLNMPQSPPCFNAGNNQNLQKDDPDTDFREEDCSSFFDEFSNEYESFIENSTDEIHQNNQVQYIPADNEQRSENTFSIEELNSQTSSQSSSIANFMEQNSPIFLMEKKQNGTAAIPIKHKYTPQNPESNRSGCMENKVSAADKHRRANSRNIMFSRKYQNPMVNIFEMNESIEQEGYHFLGYSSEGKYKFYLFDTTELQKQQTIMKLMSLNDKSSNNTITGEENTQHIVKPQRKFRKLKVPKQQYKTLNGVSTYNAHPDGKCFNFRLLNTIGTKKLEISKN